MKAYASIPIRQVVSSYDEGAGCGFDNLSPDAYAERWVDVQDGATRVMEWACPLPPGVGCQPLMFATVS